MSANSYTTKTASLRAINIDTSKINIKGENVLDIIKKNKTIVKHAKDTREEITPKDIWGTYAEKVDGEVIIHDDYFDFEKNPMTVYPTIAAQNQVIHIYDNKITDENYNLLANVETGKIVNGYKFLAGTVICHVDADFSNLKNGTKMFYNTFGFDDGFQNWHFPSLTNATGMFESSDIKSFKVKDIHNSVANIIDGTQMFCGCDYSPQHIYASFKNLKYGRGMFSYSGKNCSFGFDSDYNNYKVLPSLIDGTEMFAYSYIHTMYLDLPSLVDGTRMFYHTSNLDTFHSKAPNLTIGYQMFESSDIKECFTEFSSLIDGTKMFKNSSIGNAVNTPNLVNGDYMYVGTQKLSNVSELDLSKLKSAYEMFYGSKITSFVNCDLSSLVYGERMFLESSIEKFVCDTPNLIDGTNMFITCPKLTTFIGNLSSLVTGYQMFKGSKLDLDSIMYIASSIRDFRENPMDESYYRFEMNGSRITKSIANPKVLHIGYDTSISDMVTLCEYFDEIVDKGWTLYTNDNLYIKQS